MREKLTEMRSKTGETTEGQKKRCYWVYEGLLTCFLNLVEGAGFGKSHGKADGNEARGGYATWLRPFFDSVEEVGQGRASLNLDGSSQEIVESMMKEMHLTLAWLDAAYGLNSDDGVEMDDEKIRDSMIRWLSTAKFDLVACGLFPSDTSRQHLMESLRKFFSMAKKGDAPFLVSWSLMWEEAAELCFRAFKRAVRDQGWPKKDLEELLSMFGTVVQWGVQRVTVIATGMAQGDANRPYEQLFNDLISLAEGPRALSDSNAILNKNLAIAYMERAIAVLDTGEKFFKEKPQKRLVLLKLLEEYWVKLGDLHMDSYWIQFAHTKNYEGEGLWPKGESWEKGMAAKKEASKVTAEIRAITGDETYAVPQDQ
jgi:hypothetical protein